MNEDGQLFDTTPFVDLTKKEPTVAEPFPPGYFKGKERPKAYKVKEVKAIAVAALLDDVVAWAQSTGEADFEGEELDEFRDELREALEEHWDTNSGFEFAKGLADAYVDGLPDPDSQLVEILENASHEEGKAETLAAKHWMIDNDIKPKLEVGQMVKVSVMGQKGLEGRINEVCGVDNPHHVGVYLVGVKAHGQGDSGGYIMEWERVENPEVCG